MKKKMMQGFTLVEIMIVVAIIGILAAIAIPNFVKSRRESQTKACVANLKQIEGAVEQLLMSGNDAPTYPDDVVGADNYIKVEPLCPTNKGEYTIPDLVPTCPNYVADDAVFGGHLLPLAAAGGGD